MITFIVKLQAVMNAYQTVEIEANTIAEAETLVHNGPLDNSKWIFNEAPRLVETYSVEEVEEVK